MNNCVFCKIVAKQIPSHVVYEDEDILAFLDIAQSTYGHTLVVVKQHIENLLDLPVDLLAKASAVVQKIAQQQMRVLPAIKGFNVLYNGNEVAGQIVMHFHIHIIPRYQKEELTIASNLALKLSPTEFAALKNKLALQ